MSACRRNGTGTWASVCVLRNVGPPSKKVPPETGGSHAFSPESAQLRQGFVGQAEDDDEDEETGVKPRESAQSPHPPRAETLCPFLGRNNLPEMSKLQGIPEGRLTANRVAKRPRDIAKIERAANYLVNYNTTIRFVWCLTK